MLRAKSSALRPAIVACCIALALSGCGGGSVSVRSNFSGSSAGAPPAPATGAEKPKFDFYRILPGSEEPVSEKEIRERLRAKSGQQDAAKDVYFIQAGSFQNPADADNQKARLAILGFESSVEPANLPDKGTWYRVRMGPYAKLDEINKVRQALAQNGIDASLIKVKDQQ